jgi:hypothetical protein
MCIETVKTTKALKNYCSYYNIPFEHIIDIISDLKVIPMLRGKGFEYFVTDTLFKLLPKDKWIISNPNINAQSGVHDVDVDVLRKSDNQKIRIECKLADKDSFSISGNKTVFQVKCMRSRTVSDNQMAIRMAKKYKVSKQDVLNHADNYRKEDFDFVITSLGNAFWDTDENGKYIFNAKTEQIEILSKLFPKDFSKTDSTEQFKIKASNFMLIAKSRDLIVNPKNKIICRRKRCIKAKTSQNCGFIPNYPIIDLTEVATKKSPWVKLKNIEKTLSNF